MEKEEVSLTRRGNWSLPTAHSGGRGVEALPQLFQPSPHPAGMYKDSLSLENLLLSAGVPKEDCSLTSAA